ncbi:MAG: cytochrome c biogenesis heme-transporting ATPase CcmA [Candidatus Endonucleobacter bathymodioli]|uniref:Cytochrome c biogenesis heme-transporting ATPase CcmA n=1 Tax=Candidatus Endonucleibacter bathymodioli TaxID=539814 RepID=A0AA90NL71_9GAMM|nr:cytochrome c biogenesis heme-transporting ATPase CcmA [Candidatus Endonucleobacter bathymodioli]
MNLRCERDDNTLFTNLSFVLPPGETLHIEGCNGAGKTTLLKVLSGLTQDYQGDIFWEEHSLANNYAEFRLSSYFLGHRLGLKLELTPIENLIWRHQLSGRVAALCFAKALAQVNLQGYEDIPCRQLSMGQQRRTALAGLIASNASLWILDEPFASIDATGASWLGQQIEHHACRQGMTLITSHQPLPQSIKKLKTLKLNHYSEACYD